MSAGAPLRLMLCATEPSGDALGAALMAALREAAPGAAFVGCGGPLMAAAGLESLFPIAPFSVIGPVGAIRALPAAMGAADRLAAHAEAAPVAAAVLIDSWAFSRLVAARLRRRAPAVKRFKYVAPQVWGSRPRRAETLAALFDGVMTLFAFETEWFAPLGVKTAHVGNPAFAEAARARTDGAAFRGAHALGAGPLLAMLPGSRSGEVRRLLGPFRETVDLIRRTQTDLRVVIPVAPAVEGEVRAGVADWEARPLLVGAAERFDAFAAADAALAASGTATTELAICDTPMIAAYRLDWASAIWARMVATTKYVTLLNIAAGRAVVPEFLQQNCRPIDMAEALAPLLDDEGARRAQRDAFQALLPRLDDGAGDAARRAASAVLAWLEA